MAGSTIKEERADEKKMLGYCTLTRSGKKLYPTRDTPKKKKKRNCNEK
jgi:hypothetical protein